MSSTALPHACSRQSSRQPSHSTTYSTAIRGTASTPQMSTRAMRRSPAPRGHRQGCRCLHFPRRVCGGTPLYGLYNRATQGHFYTIDERERDEAMSDGGYEDPV
ncbi:hypothetical protein B0H17DRAFT_1080583, partial [Mycena rosella]